MPNLKISQLIDGGAAQAGDEYVVARSGGNNKITGANVAAAATSVGTLTSLTVSGNLTVDTNTLYVDAANNRVGVNCTPVVPAQIRTQTNGNVGFQPATVLSGGNKINNFNDAAAVAVGLELDASAHVLLISGTEALRLDASGNLGLGVTPSAWDSGFQVLENAGGSFSSGSNGAARLLQNAYYGTVSGVGDWRYKFTGTAASRYEMNGGEHRFFNASAGTAGNAILWAQAMTLDASGNLGVGDATPQASLNNFSASSRGIAISNPYPTIALSDTGNATWQFFLAQDIGEAYVWNRANGPLVFASNNAERARIPAAGGMVVGTAALATSATDGFLYVPTCAGTPTGTPTTQTGTAPIVVDTTNHKLYFFSGGTWRDAGP